MVLFVRSQAKFCELVGKSNFCTLLQKFEGILPAHLKSMLVLFMIIVSALRIPVLGVFLEASLRKFYTLLMESVEVHVTSIERVQ